ncbi:unnamed protein product [Prorocentrum cordatum]|uniref:Ribosomal RNA large subunit methyltransferase K/L-like methyltransferase domain-containing protein n=1 Tax=Prorocentrum cordatum TaxID=2364126 RepID=A0ABN9UTX4_9DINO|nr:unnamed protein product [Polarella glacialis]
MQRNKSLKLQLDLTGAADPALVAEAAGRCGLTHSVFEVRAHAQGGPPRAGTPAVARRVRRLRAALLRRLQRELGGPRPAEGHPRGESVASKPSCRGRSGQRVGALGSAGRPPAAAGALSILRRVDGVAGRAGSAELRRLSSALLAPASARAACVGPLVLAEDLQEFEGGLNAKGKRRKLLWPRQLLLGCRLAVGGVLGCVDGVLRRAMDRPCVPKATLGPELALCMCNLALVAPGSRVLDPFCGSGALLLCPEGRRRRPAGGAQAQLPPQRAGPAGALRARGGTAGGRGAGRHHHGPAVRVFLPDRRSEWRRPRGRPSPPRRPA